MDLSVTSYYLPVQIESTGFMTQMERAYCQVLTDYLNIVTFSFSFKR
jgi:hypothetical protein